MADSGYHCFVEIPKGSRNKYEYDVDSGCIKLDRFLYSSVVYPTDYGFIPDTWALDDDPLDAMVVVSEPTFPGCVIDVKPIALFRMRDEKGIDDKVVTFASLGVVLGFTVVVIVASVIQGRLEHRKEERKAARAAQRIGW